MKQKTYGEINRTSGFLLALTVISDIGNIWNDFFPFFSYSVLLILTLIWFISYIIYIHYNDIKTMNPYLPFFDNKKRKLFRITGYIFGPGFTAIGLYGFFSVRKFGKFVTPNHYRFFIGLVVLGSLIIILQGAFHNKKINRY